MSFDLSRHLARTNHLNERALQKAHTGNDLARVYHQQKQLKQALGQSARRV